MGSNESDYKKNEYMKLFFPDPWNYNSKPYPKDLNYLHKLPRYYAKNYLDINFLRIIKFTSLFVFGLLRKNIILFVLKNFDLIFKSVILKKLNNFILFFLFDLISLHIFLSENFLIINFLLFFEFISSLSTQ